MGDQSSFCPCEGDVLDSKLDYTQEEEPLVNSMMDTNIGASVTLSNTTPSETQGDDSHSYGMYLVWKMNLNCIKMHSNIWPQSYMYEIVFKLPFTLAAEAACTTCTVHVYTQLTVS